MPFDNGSVKGGLNPYSTGNEVVGSLVSDIKMGNKVLILILLEMRLLEPNGDNYGLIKSLNPYSTGNEVVG